MGDRTLEDLTLLEAKLTSINEIIQTVPKISDYVAQYETYKQEEQKNEFLQGIQDLMIPEFTEFIRLKIEEIEKAKQNQVPEENKTKK